MSDLFGNHIFGFPTRRLISFFREKEKKIEEMKSQKNEYKEGFWNVNTVLLGGLGKDPVLEGNT